MGMMIDGVWRDEDYAHDDAGRFERDPTTFHGRVEDRPDAAHPLEAGRYHLYVSYACPWAHRTLIVRALRGLDEAISLSVVHPYMGAEGWTFEHDPDVVPDSVHGARYLREVYAKADPTYTGRVTVPVLWDKVAGTIVNNESREIIRQLDTAFDRLATAPGFYDAARGDAIDAAIDAIYEPINNGVYRAGFAGTQAAHAEAVTGLFAALDHWEDVLSRQPYVCGDRISEADWCLFTTLLRFDPVYATHFKCNLRRIADYPNLSNYLRALYQVPGVAATCNLDHIKRHYYQSHPSINPKRLVPLGPILDLDAPHDRGRFSS
ncbi:MAG: glutathione S-transferase family protein [Myxococcales bacterium]|nr:glutathione S-transferase family protein [Myxococcales bacterium]MCB9535792.1 glutathione S-transferase family protein [Myxococcales bacterium]